ncbi:GIN domain-containing protein [Sphingobium subterraneum]|uniref:Putative auto-transporter adhesin head GIN domain-containing protein n=1 Tax=Sphingobium subterraneum TaxID=627688 RepID=A0A841J342_9SPHN|nr:DUF2807 domain-containing protein [Sphingobium subterraneum]MBB6124762.1 hypothetical protein [Sphingobium subterraneum]
MTDRFIPQEGRRARRPFFVALLGMGVLWGVLCAPSPALAAGQTYTITSFDSIRVAAPVRVVLRTGVGVSAKGEGDRAALDRISLSVSGGLLTVSIRREADGALSSATSGAPVTLTLSTGSLRRASILGGGSIAIDRIKGQRADLLIGGSGDLSVGQVAVDRLTLLIGGSGKMTVAGTAGMLDARVNGPGAIAGEGLVARTATVLNDGPGTVHLSATVSARVAASGSGDTAVDGKAACTVSQRGTGRITCAGKGY